MQRPRRVALMLNLQWPFKWHTRVFAGAQRFAQEHGWETIVDEFPHDTLSAGKAGASPYDGIITRATRQLVQVARRVRVPLVNTWANSPVRDELPGVFPDRRAAGVIRAEHLLSRGVRHFAALACRGDVDHEREAASFCQTLHDAGFPCVVTYVSRHFSRNLEAWKKSERVLTHWIDGWETPIGVNVASESIGRMVVQMCRERGLRVPDDVAVVAGTNEENFCLGPPPSLTSVELGYERVGYEAARLLGRLMSGNGGRRRTRNPNHVWIPPEGLVVRDSTDFFAVADELVASALRFIAEHGHRDIGRTDVARAVSTEPRTLHRRFLRVIGRSVVQEIRRVRIERAKRELAQTRRSISDIARAVGFGRRMRMYDVFRRVLGVTPSEYRRRRNSLRE